MNSLEELNNYANTTVTANDDRTVPYVVFDGDTSLLSLNKNEDEQYQVGQAFGYSAGKGVKVVEATDDGTANVLTITIDLSNSVASQVVWSDQKPSHVTVSEVGGVFTATNILTVDDFNNTMGNTGVGTITTIDFVDQDVNFSFTLALSYPDEFGTRTHTQPFNVILGTTSDEMAFSTSTTQQVYELQTTTLTDYPQVVDQTTNPNATYTIVIAPSTSGKLTFQTTQSFSYTNSGAEGISIGPFTKGTLNGYLAALKLEGLASGAGTTDITFQLTNNLSGVVSNGTMTGMTVLVLSKLSNANITRSYTENEVNYNLFATNPVQINPNLDTILGYGTYLIVLGATGQAPYGGRYREDGSSSVASLELQKSGTVAQLNSFLANDVNFIPDRDQFATHELRIYLYHGSIQDSSKLLDEQLFDISGTAQTGTLPGEGFYEYTSTQSTLSINDSMKYFLHCDIYAVNGGTGGLTYTLDSDIVYLNNITALELTPGSSVYVKDYSGGTSGTTLISATSTTVTNNTTSLQGTTAGTSGVPFSQHGWEYAAVNSSFSTDVKTYGFNELVGGSGLTNRIFFRFYQP